MDVRQDEEGRHKAVTISLEIERQVEEGNDVLRGISWRTVRVQGLVRRVIIYVWYLVRIIVVVSIDGSVLIEEENYMGMVCIIV